VRYFATAFMVMTLACATTDAQEGNVIAKQFFPEKLAAESHDDEVSGGYVPRQLVHSVASGNWIFAAYSNGYSGAVRVLDRSATDAKLVADSTVANMSGKAPGVELLDLDADGTPEILASFADQYGTRSYWIYAWNGETLKLLSETENSSVTGIDSNITDPTFLDTDGDGTLEIIDFKVAESRDQEGERTVEQLFTAYSIRDGNLTPGRPIKLFCGFSRGKGKPARVETDITVESMGTYQLRLVNGDNATTAATGGTVWINDAAVLVPADFKRSARIVTRPISLTSGTNVLAVQLNSGPGSHVWILIEPMP
jgi:hypothetical protein